MRIFRAAFGLLMGIFLIVISGCAVALQPEEYWLIQTSRHSELEKLMETRVNRAAAPTTNDLYPLCYAYSKLKKYNKLFPCLERMEGNIQKGDRTVVFFDFSAMPHVMRAEAYIEFGNYGAAVDESAKAYDLVVKRDLHRSSQIHTLAAMGLSHALNGDSKKARQYAVLLYDVGTYYPFNTLETEKLIGLAKIHMALGEFDKSLEAIKRDAGGSFFRFTSDVVTGAILTGQTMWAFTQLPSAFILNKSLFETGRIKEAKEGYDQLLKHPETRYNGEIYWLILHDRGRIAAREGNIGEAIEFFRQAVDVIEQQRSTINTEASKIGFVGNKQSVYHDLIAALVSAGEPAKAFEYAERSKARALVDLLAAKKDFAVQAADERQINALLSQLDASEAEARVQQTVATPDRADSRRSPGFDIKERIKAGAPELASLVTVTTASLPELQSRIRGDETLVEYYYHGEDLYAFVVGKEALQAVKLNGAGLVGDVEQWRKSLEDIQSQQYLSISQKLYRTLIQPIEPLLTRPNLILVPHGTLHYLPFNALHGGGGYLVARYSIRLLPSASVINYLKDKPADRKEQALVFGNPDLGDPRYDLRYAQEEAVTIAREFSQAKIFLQREATETAFKNVAGQFGYVHLATHGRFESDSPMNSGLYLVKDSENDGILTVGEIYSLRLNADLVTLSACETGLGKINNGDDMVGLSRGFLYAGARSIVGSLWSVEDSSTAALMASFYKNLKTMSKVEALRQAQLQLIRGEVRSDLLARRGIGGVGKLGEVPQSKPATQETLSVSTSHPYFWAPFILVGDGK